MTHLIPKSKDVYIEVATGEVKVAKAPAHLQCLALGSCVAVILYDKENKVGGIAHVMLPSSSKIKHQPHDVEALKHADLGIQELVKLLCEHGAMRDKLVARLVGGALVIADTSDIGQENIASVRKTLEESSIPIIDEHVGGQAGRSLLFNVQTGELRINGKVVEDETNQTLDIEEKVAKTKSQKPRSDLETKIVQLTQALQERTEELENIRKATFNLLEDLEKEREKLVEARAKDEAVLASIADGLVVVDMELKVTLINQATELATGWTSQEALGKSFTDILVLIDENGRPVSLKKQPLFWAVHEGKTVFTNATEGTMNYLCVRKDKTKFPIAITVSPIRSAQKILGGVLVFRDITREQEIDKAKTEFVSLASHQLRTPLTTISWYTEMILNGDVGTITPPQKNYLERVYQGNERMIELVNTLLDVSRMELGTLKAETKPTDIIALARNVLSEQEPEIKNKQLTVLTHFAEDVPIYKTDPKLLRMVFQNLLANAVAYTPVKGKIEFSIKLNDQNEIMVKVIDTGCGIPMHQQSKIFTKLFRADNVQQKETDGTGLGLYLAKSIIENAGGEIWFESEEGKGATFYVSLPMVKTNESYAKAR